MSDINVTDVAIPQILYVQWSAENIGFGELYFAQDEDGTIHCDNEYMSKEFIKAVLCEMVDRCVLEDVKD